MTIYKVLQGFLYGHFSCFVSIFVSTRTDFYILHLFHCSKLSCQNPILDFDCPFLDCPPIKFLINEIRTLDRRRNSSKVGFSYFRGQRKIALSIKYLVTEFYFTRQNWRVTTKLEEVPQELHNYPLRVKKVSIIGPVFWLYFYNVPEFHW